MPLLDHLGITVEDLPRAVAQFDPVLTALGMERTDADTGSSWYIEDETELILFPAREAGTGPHRHGTVGWSIWRSPSSPAKKSIGCMPSRSRRAGRSVREPKLYPRFNDRYYASFVEDDNGIRIEFMYNPPKVDKPSEPEWRRRP